MYLGISLAPKTKSHIQITYDAPIEQVLSFLKSNFKIRQSFFDFLAKLIKTNYPIYQLSTYDKGPRVGRDNLIHHR